LAESAVRYVAHGRRVDSGAKVELPVHVLVGADGENSRVRDLANFTIMLVVLQGVAGCCRVLQGVAGVFHLFYFVIWLILPSC